MLRRRMGGRVAGACSPRVNPHWDGACGLPEDGRLLAYGLSENGSEQSVLHVMEVDSGGVLPDRIPRTRAAELAWLPGATGFYYTRYPAPGEVPAGEEHYHRAVFFHRLGTDPASDPLVFRPAEKEHWPGVSLSPDGRWLVLEVARTFDQTDLYLQDLAAGTPPVPVAKDLPASFAGEVAHGRPGGRNGQLIIGGGRPVLSKKQSRCAAWARMAMSAG